MAAEAERVAQSGAHGALLRFVKGEVEVVVDLGIVVAFFVVDGRRQGRIWFFTAFKPRFQTTLYRHCR